MTAQQAIKLTTPAVLPSVQLEAEQLWPTAQLTAHSPFDLAQVLLVAKAHWLLYFTQPCA